VIPPGMKPWFPLRSTLPEPVPLIFLRHYHSARPWERGGNGSTEPAMACGRRDLRLDVVLRFRHAAANPVPGLPGRRYDD
jgi:hypothetical protein